MRRLLTIMCAVLLLCTMPLSAKKKRAEIKPPLFDEGSIALFSAWTFQNRNFPSIVDKRLIGGLVGVQFTVLASGGVDSINVLYTPHPALKEEAIRLVEESADLWRPAKQGRKKVNYRVKSEICVANKRASRKWPVRTYPYVQAQTIVYKDSKGSVGDNGSGLPDNITIYSRDLCRSIMTWDEANVAIASSKDLKGCRLPSIKEVTAMYDMGCVIRSKEQGGAFAPKYEMREYKFFNTLYGRYWLSDEAEGGKRAYADFTDGELKIGSALPSEKMLVRPIRSRDMSKSDADNDKPFMDAEKKPQFDGGDLRDFARWVQLSIRYPIEAAKSGIQGRVILSFVVDIDGRIGNVQVTSSPSYLLSKEAIRLVESSPKWTPAEQSGKKVKMLFHLPVVFRLKSTSRSSTPMQSAQPSSFMNAK